MKQKQVKTPQPQHLISLYAQANQQRNKQGRCRRKQMYKTIIKITGSKPRETMMCLFCNNNFIMPFFCYFLSTNISLNLFTGFYKISTVFQHDRRSVPTDRSPPLQPPFSTPVLYRYRIVGVSHILLQGNAYV